MTAVEKLILLFAIYGALYLALLAWSVRTDRRAQRREDLAKIDFIARRWKSMDQPRDRKTGRFMRKVKI